MSAAAMEQKVFKIIDEMLLSEVTRDSNLRELGCDSLDMVEIIMALEEEFEISIEDDTDIMAQFITAGDVVDLVEKLMK